MITRADVRQERVPLVLRIDTVIQGDYYTHRVILPLALRQLLVTQIGLRRAAVN